MGIVTSVTIVGLALFYKKSFFILFILMKRRAERREPIRAAEFLLETRLNPPKLEDLIKKEISPFEFEM